MTEPLEKPKGKTSVIIEDLEVKIPEWIKILQKIVEDSKKKE